MRYDSKQHGIFCVHIIKKGKNQLSKNWKVFKVLKCTHSILAQPKRLRRVQNDIYISKI